MSEQSNNQELKDLHPDPKINAYLNRFDKPSPGHIDAQGQISDPKNRQMEVGNILSSIGMLRDYKFRDETNEFKTTAEKAGLKFLAGKYPDQTNYMQEVIKDMDNLSKYSSDLEIFPESK